MENHKTNPSAVTEKQLKTGVDDLYKGRGFQGIFSTIRQVFRYGLDFRRGNPLKALFQYIQRLERERRSQWRAMHSHGRCSYWGYSCGKKQRMRHKI